MRPEDYGRLEDMLAASQDALRFTAGRIESELDTDRMFFLALVKALEIIGEAASRLSPETREQYPQIEWSAAKGAKLPRLPLPFWAIGDAAGSARCDFRERGIAPHRM